MLQLREDRRNLFFHERCSPLTTFPQGRPVSLSKHRYGDRPISNSANFPHLWNESFPRRIRGSHVLRPTHHSFPRRHRRDGESFFHAISLTSDSTILQPVNTSRLVNKELDLNCAITYVYHPVDRGFVIEPRIIVISFSSIKFSRLLVQFHHGHVCTGKYLLYCIMITSSVNRDSFYTLNPNFNRNANPTCSYTFFTRARVCVYVYFNI